MVAQRGDHVRGGFMGQFVGQTAGREFESGLTTRVQLPPPQSSRTSCELVVSGVRLIALKGRAKNGAPLNLVWGSRLGATFVLQPEGWRKCAHRIVDGFRVSQRLPCLVRDL